MGQDSTLYNQHPQERNFQSYPFFHHIPVRLLGRDQRPEGGAIPVSGERLGCGKREIGFHGLLKLYLRAIVDRRQATNKCSGCVVDESCLPTPRCSIALRRDCCLGLVTRTAVIFLSLCTIQHPFKGFLLLLVIL